jgi:hypothetical protein
VGRRGRRRGSLVRAEGRVRGRVRERVRGRGEQGGASRRGGTFDIGAIEGYASRLTGRPGGTQGLAGAASGLAGAASGLAGGSFAHRLMGSGTESSEEDFRAQVSERLDLLDERLLRLEEQMRALLEGGLGQGGEEPDPQGNQ